MIIGVDGYVLFTEVASVAEVGAFARAQIDGYRVLCL